jgi:DNA polymerase, archaea type
VPEIDRDVETDGPDPRDYDIEAYVKVLRTAFASRLVRALTPEIFAAVFDEPDQPSLFAPSLRDARPILQNLQPSSTAP